jgi:tRNA1(Val) A37 N6-methylase TrmN6
LLAQEWEMLIESEFLEPLGGGIYAITSKAHKFGADAVLLADFASPRAAKKLCDLCAGCGIVSLLWSRDGKRDIDAIELQSDAAELASRAVRHNSLTTLRVVKADLCKLDSSFNGAYDLVACNPPYKKAGSGGVSSDDAALAARHETFCTLEDVVTTGARILKGGGRFCICHRPERLTELMALMSARGVEPKRLRLVQQRISTKPWLVLVEGKKGAHPGLVIEPALIVEDEKGEYTDEMKRIYRLEY